MTDPFHPERTFRFGTSPSRLAWIFISLGFLAVAGGHSTFAGTLYVWRNNPNPAPPYATWQSAATNIQDAINAAQAGDTVLVTNGVYATGIQPGYTAGSNRVVINKAIAVRSINGPAHTWVVGAPDPNGGHGTGSVRCVYVAAGAVLDGFTLTNGYSREVIESRAEYSSRGGGAWCQSGAVLTNCVIVGNRAADDGGGVYGGTLYRCVINANSTLDFPDGNSEGDGGGADHSILYNCVVSNNRGRKGGGVDDSTVYGCVLLGNNGRVRGGGAARSTLYHCTVVDNHARYGGGVSDCTVYNSIVYHNRGATTPNHSLGIGSVSTFNFSCTTPMPESGTGNITTEPQLSSWTHLSSNSPCRAAGSSNYIMGAVDFDGQAFTNPPSMGADELRTGAALGPLLVTIESDFTNVAVGFTARFKLQVDGQTTQTRWDMGDGTLFTNQLVVTHAWATSGRYPVRLTAWNDASGPAGITATAVVSVVAAPVSFVNPASASPAFPFNSWSTAARDIQTAIAVTNTAGRIVLVTNGIYDTGGIAVWGLMTNRVALTNGVIVRSVNGPAVTFLVGAPAPGGSVGDGAIRCAYVGQGSVLDGFTLTNGYTRFNGHMSRERGGGGAWCESRGVVTNSVLTGNTAGRDGGGANGGIFFNCTFLSNQAGDEGGAVDDAIVFDCILSGNGDQHHSGAASESHFYRSIIVSNGVALGDGWIVWSTLRQSLIVGNKAGPAACELINCVIRNNNSGNGYTAGAVGCALYHCTVVANVDSNPFGFAAVRSSRIRNSIIYGNSLPETSMVDMQYSLSSLPVAGVGNITGTPLFVNEAAGDYRLRVGSPGIDGGTDLNEWTQSDLNGLRRPLDGNRDGVAAFDMGAFEFNPLFFTSITRVGSNVRLCWFDVLPGMLVQAAPSLNNPAWTNVPFAPATNCIELPAAMSNAVFRLIRP